MKTVEVLFSGEDDCEVWTAGLAKFWKTEAEDARKEANDIFASVKNMQATIVAFNSVIRQLTRSCLISTQHFNAADIRQRQPWSETLKTMDANPQPAAPESYWDKWARFRLEERE